MFRRHKPIVVPVVEAPPTPVVPRVEVDPYLGNERARVLHRAALDGQIGALGPLLQAAISPAERIWLISVLATDTRLGDTLRTWSRAQPMSLDAACAAGASLVVQAGELDDLSGVELLREADRTLLQASSLGPSSPTPWVWLLHSGRALRISTHELRLRYDHAVRDQPVSFDAASALLLGVSPRASGSRDEMFEFARSAAGGAPGGSVLHVLPVVAHIEQAIRDHPAGGASFAAALASQRADITDAAAESVDHASFVDDNPDCARARNIICFALAFAGDEAAAVRQRDAIGTRLHTSPWQLLGDPATVYATAAGH